MKKRGTFPLPVLPLVLALALAVMEAVSTVLADFTPESEAELVALAGYAVHAGRRSSARAMIGQWVKYAGDASLSDAARRLREELAGIYG